MFLKAVTVQQDILLFLHLVALKSSIELTSNWGPNNMVMKDGLTLGGGHTV